MSSVKHAPIEAPADPAPARPPLRAIAHASDTRRRDIQGLRAVAVAISGFVITRMLVGELDATGWLTPPAFYVRRIKRLLPALALMLVVVLSLSRLLGPIVTGRTTALTGAAASVFAANGYLVTLGTGYFDADTSLNPLVHTWTPAVEEQFYLAFPAVLLLGWQLRGRLGDAMGRRGAAIAVAAVSVMSFLVSLDLSSTRSSGGFDMLGRVAFYGSATRAWEFGAGALVALGAASAGRLAAAPTWLLVSTGATGARPSGTVSPCTETTTTSASTGPR